MAKQRFTGNHIHIAEVEDGSIVREVSTSKLEDYGLKLSRVENGMTHHYVLRFAGEDTAVRHMAGPRSCINFGDQVEFELLNESRPQFSGSPPAGSLALIENKLFITAKKGVAGLRLFSIADGAEYEDDLFEAVPYFSEWRLIRVVPIIKDTETVELMRSKAIG